MRRILLLAGMLFITGVVTAQTDTLRRPVLSTKNAPRSSDHLIFQLGYLSWNGAPDSISTSGLPRTFNAYLALDFPFKTNPKLSVAVGVGAATDHMYFDKMTVGIKDRTPSVVFNDQSDTNYFKKYKLATAYLEAPLELRFRSKPDDDRRSFKFAVGIKVGQLLSSHVKGKTLQNRNGDVLNDYKMKEYSKEFFNKQRFSATARIGFGHFSAFGSYSINPLFREGMGPVIRPMSIGLMISGL
ncbi:MAG: PorT family protein [Flavisolibacter sp.]|jgi:hypothetical protein|nr:PorT family protein [Flavisolibacter sp.]